MMLEAGVQPLETAPGSKKPRRPWANLIEKLQTKDDLSGWGDGGIAVVCGRVSGNLLCIDLDDKEFIAPYLEECQRLGVYQEVMQGVHETSPKGYHIFVRGDGPIGGNQKLANREDRSAVIETRGEGGYCLVAPSPGYELVSGSWGSLPVLSRSKIDSMLTAARVLNEDLPIPSSVPATTGAVLGDAVADWMSAVTWEDLLCQDGWTVHSRKGPVTYWTRPGKSPSQGVSATTGFKGQDNLIVFSSNCGLLRQGSSYTKIGWLAATRHGGDFKEATKWCRAQGFGYSPGKVSHHVTVDDEDEDMGFSVPSGGGAARIVPQAQQEPDFDLPEEIVFGEDDSIEADARYLWEPYLQRGKVVLLDADGGAGKTTLMLAIAAAISNGMNPWWEPIPEGKASTLYLYADSDEPREMEAIYRQCGGRPGHLKMINTVFQLNERSAQKVRDRADQIGASLVVIDPIMYYLSGKKGMDTNSFEVVQPTVSALAKSFEGADSCVVIVRHTNKGGSGNSQEIADPSTSGMGSQAFRAVARGQLFLKRHPERRGLAIVRSLKGSLLTKEGEPFAFMRTRHGIQWVPSFDWPEGWRQGRPSHDLTVSDVREIINGLCQRGPASRMRIESELGERGVPWYSPVVQEALRAYFTSTPPEPSTGNQWHYAPKPYRD